MEEVYVVEGGMPGFVGECDAHLGVVGHTIVGGEEGGAFRGGYYGVCTNGLVGFGDTVSVLGIEDLVDVVRDLLAVV